MNLSPRSLCLHLLVFSMSLTPTRSFSCVSEFYRGSPFVAAFITCGIKASAADLFAQSRENVALANASNKDASLKNRRANGSAFSVGWLPDVKRNLAFIIYGGAYQGVAQEYIFNHVFQEMFSSDLLGVICKVLSDVLFIGPLVNLPIAYLSKSVVFRYQHPLKRGIANYASDIREKHLLKKYWTVWAPTQCFTFGVVPQHWRIAFISLISFFWLIALSKICNDCS